MADDHHLPPEISENERHRLLADPHRRTVLAVVTAYSEATTTTSLGELASDVDRRERSHGDDGMPGEDLLVRLHHVHLPMLDEAGVVDYDPETKRIALHGPDVDTPLAARQASHSD